jgi:hypothetical protein
MHPAHCGANDPAPGVINLHLDCFKVTKHVPFHTRKECPAPNFRNSCGEEVSQFQVLIALQIDERDMPVISFLALEINALHGMSG